MRKISYEELELLHKFYKDKENGSKVILTDKDENIIDELRLERIR